MRVSRQNSKAIAKWQFYKTKNSLRCKHAAAFLHSLGDAESIRPFWAARKRIRPGPSHVRLRLPSVVEVGVPSPLHQVLRHLHLPPIPRPGLPQSPPPSTLKHHFKTTHIGLCLREKYVEYQKRFMAKPNCSSQVHCEALTFAFFANKSWHACRSTSAYGFLGFDRNSCLKTIGLL